MIDDQRTASRRPADLVGTIAQANHNMQSKARTQLGDGPAAPKQPQDRTPIVTTQKLNAPRAAKIAHIPLRPIASTQREATTNPSRISPANAINPKTLPSTVDNPFEVVKLKAFKSVARTKTVMVEKRNTIKALGNNDSIENPIKAGCAFA